MNPIAAALIEPLTGLISEFIEDKDKANELAFKAANLAGDRAHEVQIAQIGVNKQEAAHKSPFVAGWRPSIGWVCSASLAFNYLVVPVSNAVLTHFGAATITPLPNEEMMPVLYGLLGLGAYRTFEKVKGVAREK